MDLDDVFDVAELLASKRLPEGSRLAIVSNAGGPAVIAADALLARGGTLAELEERTRARLRQALPPMASHVNPVDLLDSAPPERFAEALTIVAEDSNVDAALVIFATQTNSGPRRTARAVAEVVKGLAKPVLAAWMGAGTVREGIQILNKAGLATHSTPEQAVRAFVHLVSYAKNLESLYETPREVSVHFDLNRRKVRKRLQLVLTELSGRLTTQQAEAFLKAYQIPIADSGVAHTRAEAIAIADRIGYPVALKVISPKIIQRWKWAPLRWI